MQPRKGIGRKWWHPHTASKPAQPKKKWVKRAGKWIAIATVAAATTVGGIHYYPKMKEAREVQMIENYSNAAREEMAFVRVKGKLIPYAERRRTDEVDFKRLNGNETELVHTHVYGGSKKIDRLRKSNPAANDILQLVYVTQAALEKNPKKRPTLEKCTIYTLDQSGKKMGKIEVSLEDKALQNSDNLERIEMELFQWNRTLKEVNMNVMAEIYPNYLEKLSELQQYGLKLKITPANGHVYHEGFFQKK